MPSPRRFPAPWSAEVTPNCFIVRDADGQQLAYVYYESEPERRSTAKLLTAQITPVITCLAQHKIAALWGVSKDEARRIAVNFARLPDLLRAQPHWR